MQRAPPGPVARFIGYCPGHIRDIWRGGEGHRKGVGGEKWGRGKGRGDWRLRLHSS